ncbi:thioredoxin-like protein [Phellopilus nigrolimitatus]|nr:thioredoxin-like protein [Phellopilus nigrolimitatus]
MPRLFRFPPATPPINKRSLLAKASNGHQSFIPQIRKLVFEYCDNWPSSANLRSYIYNHAEQVARENPHVEFVVKQRPSKEPIIRGFYLNNRDKVIGLKDFEVTQIQQKVQLLLDASGAKIVPLKRKTVVSTTEAARGIWSGFHVPEPYKI